MWFEIAVVVLLVCVVGLLVRVEIQLGAIFEALSARR